MSYQARVSKRGPYVVVEIPRVLKPDPMCISHQASGQERCLVLLNHFIYTGIFSAFWPVCSERDSSRLSLLWARVVSVDVMLLYWHYVFKASPHAFCSELLMRSAVLPPSRVPYTVCMGWSL